MEIYTNELGHMIKMTFKNLVLYNQRTDDLRAWYVASGTRVLPRLFKWWPWGDLGLNKYMKICE